MNPEKNIQQDDIKFIDEVNDMIWELRTNGSNNSNPMEKAQLALERAITLDYKTGIARGKLNMGMGTFIIHHNSDEALRLLNESLEMFKALGDERWIANAHLTVAIISSSAGKPEVAFYHALCGIPFYENKNNEGDTDAVMAYYVTGTVFKDLKKHYEAEDYYKKGLSTAAEDNSWTGRIYTSLANIYTDKGDFDKALELSYKSLNILEKENNLVGISRVRSDIGSIERNMKNYPKALDHFHKALEIREQTNMKHFVLGSLMDIALTYSEMGDHSNAISFFHRAEEIALQTKHELRLSTIFTKLAELYKTTNEALKAIGYYEKLIKLNHEVHQKERAAKIENFQNTLLQEKEKEIERLKNVELKEAYELISEKNKEITDSIHYAQRIQKTLLASDELLTSYLKDHFILFKPKDIVSGDFYWATALSSELNVQSFKNTHSSNSELQTSKLFYLAVCDSTGHGVPGAFMSLLNITFLKEAINQKHITDPGKILNHVRELLISSVSQDGAQDGMDGNLLCIYKEDENTFLNYASANNQGILFSNGGISFLNADKMPVGKGEKTDSFKTYKLSPKAGDVLYLFTDGYADQFGGEKGKKFKTRQLEALIKSVAGEPLHIQKKVILERFEAWKGNHEQVDDVLVIAIKF